MKRLAITALLASALFITLPTPAQAALTSSQIDAVLGLLSAFNTDSDTISRVRATLRGGAAPTPGTLWFGAGTQPTATEVARNSTDIPFTTVTLTNNSSVSATIYTITVLRAGTASDSAVRTITLMDGATSLASATDLDTKHQATLAPENLTIPAGQSMTLTLAGDLSNKARSNKTIGLTVVALNTSSPISGALPLEGTLYTIK